MVFRVESRPGACDKKSNSKYPFPFETVSVVGILKIVDCAIAVCAVTTNKRATNNPERTLNLFTVFTPPFFFKRKKNAQQHPTLGCILGRLCLQNFLPHSLVRRESSFNAASPWLSNKYFLKCRQNSLLTGSDQITY